MRRFEKHDWKEFASWHTDRGQHAPPQELAPPFGIIEPGLAVGFLYVSHPIAYADLLATNPHAPVVARAKALRKISLLLIKEAKYRKCKVIVTTTKLSETAKLAKRLGLVSHGQYEVWGKDL